MKKNLRIVSAAAALLAVAPVAAAVSVNAADSTATTTAKATDYTTSILVAQLFQAMKTK